MYGTIVVGTDGSATATSAVRRAAQLAAQSAEPLVVVSAYEPVSEARLLGERRAAPADVAWSINPQEDVEALLSAARQIAESEGAKDVRTSAIAAVPSEAILDIAQKSNAGLIVVGSLGMRGATRFLMGSVPNRVAHHAPCDVLIVRTDDRA